MLFRSGISDIPVQHIASARLGENWNGKQARPRKWRQFGILTVNGFTALDPSATEVPPVIRLTDTAFGETVELHRDDLDKHVQVGPNGLIFQGKDIGRMHIHVAYFAD